MRDTRFVKEVEFTSPICSVAQTLEIVGERWTLLVVREAFFGTRRFSDFETILGIAKNVLSDRLAKLVAFGVLERTSLVGRGNPGDYTLTRKGRDLFPVIVALMQWGDKWVYGEAGAPVRVVERATGEEIDEMRVSTRKGAPLVARETAIVPGPGADAAVRRRFGAR